MSCALCTGDKFLPLRRSLVAWVAVDEISPNAVTMQFGRGSHRRFTNAFPNASKFEQEKFCPLFMEDLQKETRRETAFLDSFIELPKLDPGDAVFFNGMTYHRPMPYCKQGCTRTNSRRIALRYIAGERTTFRSDTPSIATHFATRWCPSYLFQMLGYECRAKAGEPVLSRADMPVVIDLNGARKIPTDGISGEWFTPPPLPFFFGSGHRVHHDTCGLESEYVQKVFRRLFYRTLPILDKWIFGGTPELRPGEEELVD